MGQDDGRVRWGRRALARRVQELEQERDELVARVGRIEAGLRVAGAALSATGATGAGDTAA